MCQQAVCNQKTIDIETAKRIMGSNFVGIDDLDERAGHPFLPEDFDFFSKIPFPAEFLERHQNSHILIPGLGMSILEAHIQVPLFRSIFNSDPWWITEDFAVESRTDRRWYLLRRAALPETVDRPYADQAKIVEENGEIVPRGCELICAIIFYYLATGIRIFENVKSYCSDILIDGVHFHVGFFKSGHNYQVDVRGYRNPIDLKNIGTAGIRKPELAP